MKKVIEVVLITLLAIAGVFTFAGLLNTCSDDGLSPYLCKQSKTVCTDVDTSVENYLNPSMTSPVDVVVVKNNMCTEKEIDSIFCQLSDKTLTDISSVLLKKSPSVTKADVVHEYQANRRIYDNLPSDKPDSTSTKESSKPIAKIELVKEENTTVTEAPPTRVGYKDTVINGKMRLISIQQIWKSKLS